MSLPTVEQVREHADKYPIPGGGLWRFVFLGVPHYAVVAGHEANVAVSSLACHLPGIDWPKCTSWTPCDQAGNPLPLVADRDGWKKTADDHYRMHQHASQELKRERARADKSEQERDVERARANEAEANYRWMVKREAERKLDGYRELGDKAAAAENERDYYRDQHDKMRAQGDEYRRQRDELRRQCDDLGSQLAALRVRTGMEKVTWHAAMDAVQYLPAHYRSDTSDIKRRKDIAMLEGWAKEHNAVLMAFEHQYVGCSAFVERDGHRLEIWVDVDENYDLAVVCREVRAL